MAINKLNVTQSILNSQAKSKNIPQKTLQLMRNQGLTLQEIADTLHVSTSNVSKHVKMYKIPLLKTDFSKVDKEFLANINELIAQGLSVRKIAEQLKLSYGRVRVLCEHFNLKTQPGENYVNRKQLIADMNNAIDNNDYHYLNSVNYKNLNKNPIFSKTHDTFLESISKSDLEELINNGHSIDDIAIMFSTSQSYIAKLFSKYRLKSHSL